MLKQVQHDEITHSYVLFSIYLANAVKKSRLQFALMLISPYEAQVRHTHTSYTAYSCAMISFFIYILGPDREAKRIWNYSESRNCSVCLSPLHVLLIDKKFKFVHKYLFMQKIILRFAIIAFITSFYSIINNAAAQQTRTTKTDTSKTSGYAPINGLKMYYEIYGEGKPILLLHGSYMNIDLNYGEIIPELEKHHKVIAIEMQGHGRTADIDRDYSWEAMADDAAAMLAYLKIDKADILGYSFGATVGLELAIKHPALVNKLVFISSVYKSDGWIKPVRNIFPMIKPEFFEHTPLRTYYNKLAPGTSHWKAFVNKLAKFDATSFDLGIENVKSIKSPVLIIKGDNDGVDLSHVAEMYEALGGGVSGDMAGMPKSQLAVIPNTTHVTLMMSTHVINPFLDK